MEVDEEDLAAERKVRAIAKRRRIIVPEGFVRGAVVARAYLYDIVPKTKSTIDHGQ